MPSQKQGWTPGHRMYFDQRPQWAFRAHAQPIIAILGCIPNKCVEIGFVLLRQDSGCSDQVRMVYAFKFAILSFVSWSKAS